MEGRGKLQLPVGRSFWEDGSSKNRGYPAEQTRPHCTHATRNEPESTQFFSAFQNSNVLGLYIQYNKNVTR